MPLPATITDRELWALTLKVERVHGEHARAHAAERIAAATAAGETIGVELWEAVEQRQQQLSCALPRKD
ncbi:DUF6961 family protein [Sphingomonas radiodurans]|uniref:DUF6961 family protein n=1 Tax=Sphingomonas radiodurans TaxID=2890321 RepID=UPI001E306ADE|nr:hypothetical protein [Sphingomonas radiodurans]WBH15295.1 hypothetical protein LLW23_10605 [Sphingomonas radiodurans]